MGVVISCYTGIKKEEVLDEENDGWKFLHIYNNNCGFPLHLGSQFKDNDYFSFVDKERCYSSSYSGYNYFRKQIESMAEYQDMSEADDLTDEEVKFFRLFESYHAKPEMFKSYLDANKRMPFLELILFSDCEGFICTEYLKRIHKDFEFFYEQAKTTFDEIQLFDYKEFKKTLDNASSNDYILGFS